MLTLNKKKSIKLWENKKIKFDILDNMYDCENLHTSTQPFLATQSNKKMWDSMWKQAQAKVGSCNTNKFKRAHLSAYCQIYLVKGVAFFFFNFFHSLWILSGY